MTAAALRFADPVVVGSGVAWLEQREDKVVVCAEDAALVVEGVEPAWARPGNGGVLAAGAEGSLWVLERSGGLQHLDGGASPRRVLELRGARQVTSSPSGGFVVVRSSSLAVVLDAVGRVIRAFSLEPFGEVYDAAVGDDGSVALGVAGAWEPWATGSVVVLEATGSLRVAVGGGGHSVVEPRWVEGAWWVRDDELGAHQPRLLAGESTAIPSPYDVGEYPLGPTRRGYVVRGDQVIGLVAAVEAPALVVREGSGWRPWRDGAFTSLSFAGDELVGLEHTPWGQVLWRGSTVLARVERDPGVLAIKPLTALGLGSHGIAVVPPAPRGVCLAIHGGPIEQVGWPIPEKWLAAARRGYLVVAPDYRGSYGYGRAFREQLVGGWGEQEVAELAELVAALRGLVAGPVVGVGSSSAGWTLLQLALREPDALDALSLVNPVLDASSLPDVAWLVAPSSRERAAQRFARRIPVLITHGLADAVVPAEQSRRFAERTSDDLEVQLVTPPSEGHSLGSAASAADVARFEALLLGLASGRR